MEPPAVPQEDGLAAITRQNFRALLVTRSQLQALAPLIAALAGRVAYFLSRAWQGERHGMASVQQSLWERCMVVGASWRACSGCKA